MRIAFVGAVEGSLVALETLVARGYAPVLVVTLPPEARERHSDFVDLRTTATRAGCALHLTTNINAPETVAALSANRIDLTLVVGWSQICRRGFRDAARLGAIGYHPTPLPQMRGRAVIAWTILAGASETGSTLFWLDEGVDSGGILAQRRYRVAANETARSLYEKHKAVLPELILDAVGKVEAGDLLGVAQDEALASYCARRTPEDGLIDWTADSGSILRLIRAVGDPYAGAFTFFQGEKLTLHAAEPDAPRGRHNGLVGQVQACHGNRFIVLCGDGATIAATSWESVSGKPPKVHTRLTPS